MQNIYGEDFQSNYWSQISTASLSQDPLIFRLTNNTKPVFSTILLRLWVTEVGMAAVKMDQFSVAVYVKLQLQNMEDESRGMTQTCTARSNEISPRSGRAHKVKVHKFSSQVLLPQTTVREKGNAEGQFLRSGRRPFLKVRWLRVLRYNCKTWRMSREAWHKLA